MKLLIPVLDQFRIQAGFGLRNLHSAAIVEVSLWKNFENLAKRTLPIGRSTGQMFIHDLFSSDELVGATLATVEAQNSEGVALPPSPFEAQLALRSDDRSNFASVLYDLLPDKKPGHTYSPILHSAQIGITSSIINSYSVFVNYRPPYLRSAGVQKMWMELKNSDGSLLHRKMIKIPFNATTAVSFSEEFSAFGGHKSGSQLNFKGGESQFAIFTLFQNRNSGALGLEHSLPPVYYCSDIYQAENRKIFFKNAFKGTELPT